MSRVRDGGGAALAAVLASRRVLFVGGKGGVGKTTIAAAAALEQARRGRRVLLVSTDPAHNLGHLWERRIGPAPVELAPGLEAMEIDPEATARAHLRQLAETLHALMPEHLGGEVDRYLRLAADAPGAHEAAMLERIAELAQLAEEEYGLVVFDTAPSGHTARLVGLPETMAAWTEALLDNRRRAERFGRARDAFDGRGLLEEAEDSSRARRRMRDHEIRRVLLARREKFLRLRTMLRDETITGFLIVLAAARLPVLETIELRERLGAAGVRTAGLVVNKRSPRDAGALLAERRACEERWLEQLRERVPDAPIAEVPLLAADPLGAPGLERVAGLLLR